MVNGDKYNQDLNNILEKVNNIFGIHEYLVAYKIDTDIELIKQTVTDIMSKEKFNTFKIETKRSYKKFPYTSMEVNPILGGHLLKNINNISVDVHNPDILIKVEIREKYSAD